MSQLILNRVGRYPRIADLVTLLAGCCYPLALAPFDYWFAGIISIFLLLMLTVEPTVGRGLLRFYLFAIGMYGVGTSWLYVSVHEHGQAPALLAGTLIALFVMAISLLALVPGYLFLRLFRQNNFNIVIGFAVLWVVREWLYSWVLTGFPWLLAGYGQLDTPLAGYAPWLGVLGVSFTVVLTSGLIFATLKTGPGLKNLLLLASLGAVWLAGLGLSRLDLVQPGGSTVSVSVVQGNIDQKVKWRREMAMPIVNAYLALSRDEWGRELIVWPEAAVTLFRESATGLLQKLGAKGEMSGTTLVMGIPDRDEQGNFLNSAIAVGAGQGRYIKRHLVPFGEYIPAERLLRGIIRFLDMPMSHNRPGPDYQPLLEAAGLKLAVSICYEVVFSDLVRRNPGVPDLLVTISNDSWFGNSIGPLQHMQMARMRALENGRYLIRGTNNGVTALVDHRGRLISQLPQFEPGVLRGEVLVMSGITPYSRWGDAAVLALCVALMGMLAWRHRYNH